MVYHDYEHRVMDRERRAMMQSQVTRRKNPAWCCALGRLFVGFGKTMIRTGKRLQERPAV